MGIRRIASEKFGGWPAEQMRRLNARHPWSHDDAFHPWILTRLPERRERALDVGCGRGELLASFAPHFDQVVGLDTDEEMRAEADRRCAGLPNVSVPDTSYEEVPGQFDLVTMIAVLHHLDVEAALHRVRELLRPGGKFLCVGLAPPQSLVDHLWDVASMATNPLIGFVRHPWPSTSPAQADPFPVRIPELGFEELRDITARGLPGATLKHHLGFRHTIEWTATP